MKKRLMVWVFFLFLIGPGFLYADSIGAAMKSKAKAAAKGAGDFTQYMLGLPFTLAQRALQKVDILG